MPFQKLDTRVCFPIMHITAEVALEKFSAKVRSLFQGAANDVEMLGKRGAGPCFAVLIGPLKGEPRSLVKMEEYREENRNPDKWAFSTMVRSPPRERVGICDVLSCALRP